MRASLVICCTVFLFALSGRLGAQPLPTWEATPAWQGLFHPWQETELQLSIRPEQSATAKLFITNTAIDKHLDLQLTAGVSHELSIPVRLSNNNSISLELSLPGQTPQKKSVWFHRAVNYDRIVAIAAADANPPEISNTQLLKTSAGMLPHHGQAYRMIDTLVLDQASLAALSNNQLQALEEYLSGCGDLITIAMPDEIATALKQNAACHGDNIKAIQSADLLTESLKTSSPYPAKMVQTPQQLQRLARQALPDNRILTSITFFFVLYFSALLLTRYLNRRAEALIAVSGAASLLATFAWSGNNPQTDAYTWLEMNSGANSARYSLLLRQLGNGLGETQITLPAFLHDPLPLDSDTLATKIHLDMPNTLKMPTALLNHAQLYFEGRMHHNIPASLLNRNGKAQIINHGATAIENAFLLWEGKLIALPTIEAHGGWSDDATSNIFTTTAPPPDLAQLLDLQRANNAHALLIKLPDLMGATIPAQSQHGWLIIHA
jgi:hypothetical protein